MQSLQAMINKEEKNNLTMNLPHYLQLLLKERPLYRLPSAQVMVRCPMPMSISVHHRTRQEVRNNWNVQLSNRMSSFLAPHSHHLSNQRLQPGKLPQRLRQHSRRAQ